MFAACIPSCESRLIFKMWFEAVEGHIGTVFHFADTIKQWKGVWANKKKSATLRFISLFRLLSLPPYKWDKMNCKAIN